jgi:hypothetical protein
MSDMANIQQAVNDTVDRLINNRLNEVGGSGESGGGESKGWLAAMARALGGMLGDRAAKMIEYQSKMDDLNDQLKNIGEDDSKALQENARDFQLAMTQFQTEAQMFGILSNATATSIKAIGEGMVSVARKQ